MRKPITITYLLLVIASFLLAACDDDRACIEADDWGYPKPFVSSESSALEISGEMDAQQAEWLDSKRVIIDAGQVPLIISVGRKDKWTSWFNGHPDLVPKGHFCGYRETTLADFNTSIVKAQGFPKDCTAEDSPDVYQDCHAPCWLKEGYGLYVFFGDINHPESGTSVHLADEDGDGYLFTGYPSELGAHTGDRLYFKILDRYYDDNKGGYTVRLKAGTKDPNPGPIEYIVNAVKAPIDVAMKNIYQGIVTNGSFIRIVQAALTLYVVLYALSFILGIQGTTSFQHLLVRTLQVGTVITVISPGSWEFFYGHFFSLFLDGIEEIVALVATPFSEFDPANPWYSLDQTLKQFFSDATWSKTWSLLFSSRVAMDFDTSSVRSGAGEVVAGNAAAAPSLMFDIISGALSGFFVNLMFILLVYFSLLLFVVVLIKAVIVYLTSYVLIAFLILLFPIFIIFMLFSITRERFQDWVSHMGGAAIQQILLFAAVGMFISFIMETLHRMLGFTICWETWLPIQIPLSLAGGGLEDIGPFYEFKTWFPHIDLNQRADLILDNGNGAYELLRDRYIDLPYLDPVADKEKILAMHAGEYVRLGDLIVFMGIILLMSKFIDMVPTIASFIQSSIGRSSRYDVANFAATGQNLWDSGLEAMLGKQASDKDYADASNQPGLNASKRYTNITRRQGGLIGSMIDYGQYLATGTGRAGSSIMDTIQKGLKSRTTPETPLVPSDAPAPQTQKPPVSKTLENLSPQHMAEHDALQKEISNIQDELASLQPNDPKMVELQDKLLKTKGDLSKFMNKHDIS